MLAYGSFLAKEQHSHSPPRTRAPMAVPCSPSMWLALFTGIAESCARMFDWDLEMTSETKKFSNGWIKRNGSVPLSQEQAVEQMRTENALEPATIPFHKKPLAGQTNRAGRQPAKPNYCLVLLFLTLHLPLQGLLVMLCVKRGADHRITQ